MSDHCTLLFWWWYTGIDYSGQQVSVTRASNRHHHHELDPHSIHHQIKKVTCSKRWKPFPWKIIGQSMGSFTIVQVGVSFLRPLLKNACQFDITTRSWHVTLGKQPFPKIRWLLFACEKFLFFYRTVKCARNDWKRNKSQILRCFAQCEVYQAKGQEGLLSRLFLTRGCRHER